MYVYTWHNFFYRLAKNACYEMNRTSVWLYFDMSEITVEEEYRDDGQTALQMTT